MALTAAPGSGSGSGSGSDSGLTRAKGSVWVGPYRNRKIHQVSPQTGAVIRGIESDRFVTGVTWVDGKLRHGTWENDASELRRIDPGVARRPSADALAQPMHDPMTER